MGTHAFHALGIVALSADARGRLLSSSVDGAVALWDWDGEDVHLAGSTASVQAASVDGEPFGCSAWATALHPDGSVFAAAGEGLHVALFSADADTFGAGVRRFARGSPADVFGTKLAFNRDGSLLAAGTNQGQVLLYDVAHGALITSIPDHAHPVRALCFTPPGTQFGDQLLVGSDDRTTTVHDVQRVLTLRIASTITSLQGHKGWILDAQSSGGGRIVATSASDGMVRLWDLAASPVACVSVFAQRSPIWSVAWQPEATANEGSADVDVSLLAPGANLVTGEDGGVLRRYRNAGAGGGRQEEAARSKQSETRSGAAVV
ncbi:Ski complex subunit Rec14 [Malassezia sp. CBS 17886]|nr:Ski complex subunit Rec14 [Malassezia sp. CBS 17886]